MGARERNPNEYLRVIASILPKDQNFRVQSDELSEKFAAMLERRDGAKPIEENAALKGEDDETDTAVH